MNFKKLALLTLSLSLIFQACESDDAVVDLPLGDYENGMLVLNQGNFGAGNSSISYFSYDYEVFQANAFQAVNPAISLGDTGQDIGFYEDKAFVVMNNSNKIEIINRYTLEHITTISTGLNNPRYITFAQGKAFVTNWGSGMNPDDDYVAVYNLNDYSLSANIPVVEGPERILTHNNKVYVAHEGGFNFNNQISVINPANNQVQTTVEVGDVPKSLQVYNNQIYVLCGGIPSWAQNQSETGGSLYKINEANEASQVLAFDTSNHPSNLIQENSQFYFSIDSEVFQMNANATTVPTSSIFETTSQGVYGIYSMAIRNGLIHVGDAADYNSNGKILIFQTNGTLVQEKTVGVIPAGFYFN
jgi:YVTN family beta-propeller protein